jgi:hypothetical protein
MVMRDIPREEWNALQVVESIWWCASTGSRSRGSGEPQTGPPINWPDVTR